MHKFSVIDQARLCQRLDRADAERLFCFGPKPLWYYVVLEWLKRCSQFWRNEICHWIGHDFRGTESYQWCPRCGGERGSTRLS